MSLTEEFPISKSLKEKTDELFGFDPNVTRRGSLLPIVETAQGETTFGAPEWLHSMAQSFMLPGHAVEGGTYTPEDVTNMALDYGIWGAGAGAALVPEGALAVGAGRAPGFGARGVIVGQDPYKVAREQGLPVDTAPESFLYDDKIFHPDIRYDPTLKEYPQIMGGTSVVVMPNPDGTVNLYNSFGEGVPTKIDPTNLTNNEFKEAVESVQGQTSLNREYKGVHIPPAQIDELNDAASKYLNAKVYAKTPETVEQTVQEMATLADALGWLGENTKMLGLGGGLEIIPDLAIKHGGPGGFFTTAGEIPMFATQPRSGALAHEFGHGFDEYMRRRFMPKSAEARYGSHVADTSELTQDIFKARPEVRIAYNNVLRPIVSGNYKYASSRLDEMKGYQTGYFGTPTELFARAFDQYIYTKTKDRNLPINNNLYTSYSKAFVDAEEQLKQINDQLTELTRIEKQAETVDLAKLDPEQLTEFLNFIQTIPSQRAATEGIKKQIMAAQSAIMMQYPLPQGAQRDAINQAFDEFFSTVKVVKEYAPNGQPRYELWMIPAAATAGGLALAGESGEAQAGTLLEDFPLEGVAPTRSYFQEFTKREAPVDLPAEILAFEGGIKTQGYVPPDSNLNSGVTIGGGIDLGQMNTKDLSKLGLGKDLFTKLSPYLGIKGTAAHELAQKDPLLLSQGEAIKITKAKMAYDKEQLTNEFNKDSWFLKYDQLPRPVQIVMESLKHHYGNVKQSWPTIWQYAQNADYEGIMQELAANEGEFKERRLKEAAIIRKYLGQ